MFGTVIFYFLVSFLSVYGFVSLILYIRNLFSDMGVMKGKSLFYVVGLKNEEEKAEGIARGKALNQECNLRGPGNSKEVNMAK